MLAALPALTVIPHRPRDFAGAFSRAEDHLDFNSMIRRIEDAYRNAGDMVQGRVSS